MWKLKVAEGHGPYLYSTNNFVGRQIWEFNPEAGTPEEREEVEKAREYYRNNRRQGVHPCGDMIMRMQVRIKLKQPSYILLTQIIVSKDLEHRGSAYVAFGYHKFVNNVKKKITMVMKFIYFVIS